MGSIFKKNIKPVVAYVTWNRLGMTIKNLESLFKTKDDFELYIVDNNSTDNTREYLQTIQDPRITKIEKFDKNYGLVYALNYVISNRKPQQPFINIDADVEILSPHWITACENIIKEFPEIGILGNVRNTYFTEKNVAYKKIVRNDATFLKTDTLMGCCMYFPAPIIDQLGYFNEEIGLPDLEMNVRITAMGKWLGYCKDNIIVYKDPACDSCNHNSFCPEPHIADGVRQCYIDYIKNYKHGQMYQKNYLELDNYRKNITPKTIYCPSVHDPKSQKKVKLDINKAQENFRFFN